VLLGPLGQQEQPGLLAQQGRPGRVQLDPKGLQVQPVPQVRRVLKVLLALLDQQAQLEVKV